MGSFGFARLVKKWYFFLGMHYEILYLLFFLHNFDICFLNV